VAVAEESTMSEMNCKSPPDDDFEWWWALSLGHFPPRPRRHLFRDTFCGDNAR
jgi:hypothetical protein